MPAGAIERWYSRGVYPRLQHVLTGLSNLAPFSLFDVLCLFALVATVLLLYRSVRDGGVGRGLWRAMRTLAPAAAAIYLVFLSTWGLNYRRVPITDKLAFDPAKATPAAVTGLGERAVVSLNQLYRPAHESPTPLPALSAAFESVQAALGSPPIVPSRPKSTLLGGYFHNAAIAGMTDPFLLETLVAPDLLDVEKPFVIAHEWGHLAGYADESEANFLAWLTCMRADDAARYSAWLVLLGALEPPFRKLNIGTRIDIFAMTYRYSHTPRLLRFAAREGYDKYLKANRVKKGVESYDAVVHLIVGTTFDPSGNPVMRQAH
jgi:hypothetical protein